MEKGCVCCDFFQDMQDMEDMEDYEGTGNIIF